MANGIRLEDLGGAIADTLTVYGKETQEKVNKAGRKAIKEVENEIGITVFRRSAKGVYPTPEGAEFLRNARLVTEQFRKLEAAYKTEKTKKITQTDKI